MTTEAICECGHEAKHHAISNPNWKKAICLTQFYAVLDKRTPTGCRCQEYRPA